MAQPAHLNQNLPDLGGPFLYRDQDDGEKSSYSVETAYGFTLDLDFLKYVDDIQSGQTLKKLHRKAKGPKHQLSCLRSPGSHASGWTSTESLASTASEDGRTTLLLSPHARTQSNSSETREALSKQLSNPMSPTSVINLLPPPSPKSLLRNPRVEKTLLETSRRLEQEQLNLLSSGNAQIPKPPSSPSKTSNSISSAASVTQSRSCSSVPSNGNGDSQAILSPSLIGSMKMSPFSSGWTTPATNLSATHLQHVREQMAAALKQLKELEEQVKTIPVLEMKISKLKQEKEKLLAGLQEKASPETSETSAFTFPPQSPTASEEQPPASQETQGELEGEAELGKARASKITELRKLTEKLSTSERNVRAGRTGTRPARPSDRACKSVGVGEEMDMNDVVFYYRSQQPCREVAVGQETATRDAAVWVMESLLGLSTESEKEIELLQHTVSHQKEVINMMEGHLKEATKELEELRVEVCSRRPGKLIDKEIMAKPQLAEACVEAVVPMQNQAVGSPLEMIDEGVDCSPRMLCIGINYDLKGKEVAVGPDSALTCEEKATQANLEAGITVPRVAAVAEAGLQAAAGESTQRQKDAGEAGNQVNFTEPGAAGGSKAAGAPGEKGPSEKKQSPCLSLKDSKTGMQECVPTARATTWENDSRAPLSTGTGSLKSIMKKRDGLPKNEAEGGRKSLQFVGVLNGEYESTSSEEEDGDSSSEKISPNSSDSDAEGGIDSSDEDVNVGENESDLENPEVDTEQRKSEERHERREEQIPAPEPPEVKEKFELSPRMREACVIVKSHLSHPSSAKSKEVLSSSSLILQEWFRVSSQKSSVSEMVANHLMAFTEVSPALLAHVVNLSDGNGNTALHYSVSHSNFQIVRLLLDTGVCNVDHQNKAGYTALMLAALAAVEHEEDMNVVRRLFSMGNVNAKASQAGQTALMLAVSHGRQEMVEALLACGADVNLQDEEGSTALMCACEHGRVETVRLLLAQPACDLSIVDNDGNNAVAIALEAGHSNIAVLMYTHLNSSKAQSPQGKSPTIPRKQH
ncbi:PREDICTED: KN motif and ankyrin repeat domain-containing protein 3 isoform X1 [Crocodylus porosus]|uniref:KN motif and ankyrin repeat domains 3 n=1 Tax=Crocodylus porosus TaxID=8502 RepID=A0A7M4F572_CROPO|nr:PREDICTED: KN motif and ankyrin repeat domain-containing protein 3 isoform X1 [Crocodylus porosus]XP_019406176.1 PREDICTED: KN motif and ankyrin repeat domain-containing protein 3 isoform X1 [Crocodylus porosus]XP_019406177.1 PREDICTED: KN motif and ankyrin repeat domain-containing protein 3 isoform X1 [Crocodylus porosus]